MVTMMENLTNGTMDTFKGLFGKINPGLCRLSLNGSIAVKTSHGYKTYDVSTGKLVNCSNFFVLFMIFESFKNFFINSLVSNKFWLVFCF